MNWDAIIMLLQLYIVFLPQDGGTALLVASDKGHEEVVRLLLQSGAKNIRDKVSGSDITSS